MVCSARPYSGYSEILDACEAILDQMETSEEIRIFAQQDIHEPNLETPLPVWYTAPAEGECIVTPYPHLHSTSTLTVDSKAPECALRITGGLPRQFASWYIIWEAATAINAMCIRQRKGGFWQRLGKLKPFVRESEELQRFTLT